MYPALVNGPLPFVPPWESQTFDRRWSAIEAGSPRVAWLCEEPDYGTFRYRVYNMVEALSIPGPRHCGAAWFRESEINQLIPRLSGIDVLILARVRYSAGVAHLVTAARAKNVKVLYDCDDLVFDTRYVHLLLEALAQEPDRLQDWDFWFAMVARIQEAARLCDGGLATNAALAAHLREVVPGPVAVLPNFLNRQQQGFSDELLSVKAERNFQTQAPICIGYFSGTASHRLDFGVASAALARLLARQPDVVVRIVGFLDRLGPLASFPERIEHLPLHDWVNLQRLIAEVDVNLVPLQASLFTECKSELKFFEAAAVGTWTIASPSWANRQVCADPRRGRLAPAEDWDDALADAVELARSPERYAELAMANAAYVADHYGWDRFAARIREATLGQG